MVLWWRPPPTSKLPKFSRSCSMSSPANNQWSFNQISQVSQYLASKYLSISGPSTNIKSQYLGPQLKSVIAECKCILIRLKYITYMSQLMFNHTFYSMITWNCQKVNASCTQTRHQKLIPTHVLTSFTYIICVLSQIWLHINHFRVQEKAGS